MDWIYLTLVNGRLTEDDGAIFSKRVFASDVEAEAWIESEDIRATLR